MTAFMTSGDNLRMATPSLPQVNISEHGKVRYLHLGSEWVQGSMDIGKPNAIHLDYVQRMQAWLLFVEPDAVSPLHAMQLGLGAGALTKNCHKVLGMQTTAIELNPQVIGACRSWFALPADDDKLSVVLGDAAEVVAHTIGVGKLTSCMSTCTTTKRQRRCWTMPTFTPNVVNCSPPKAAWWSTCLAALPVMTKAWHISPKPLGSKRYGPSNPPKKAIPWCWRRLRCSALSEKFCKPGPRPYKRALACPHPCGSRFSSR